MKPLTFTITLLIAFAGLFAAVLIPYKTQTICIIKSQITENRPFAGVINDMYVGSEVCCEYLYAREKCADTAYYLSTKSLLGATISIKDITGAQ